MKNILLLLFFAAACSLFGQEITGTVMSIENGYCFTLLGDDNQQYKVRLYGMYGPNPGQPFHKESKDYLTLLIENQDVRVAIDQKDRYGRIVGKVYSNGQYINAEMVSTGNGWWDNTNAVDDGEMQLAEQEAAGKRIGVWLYHKTPLKEESQPNDSKKVLEIGKSAKSVDKGNTAEDKDDMQLMDKDGKVDVIKTFRELGKAYRNIDENVQ